MTAPSCHVGLDRLRADAGAVDRDLPATRRATRSLRRRRRSANATAARPSGARSARSWRALGKSVNAEGLAFGWHNHNWEYQQGRGRPRLSRPDVRRGAGPRSGRRTSPGSRAAAPIRRPSCGATAAASSPATSRTSRRRANASTRMAGPIRATACSTGRRCAPRCDETACTLLVVEHDKPNDVARFARRAAETVAQLGVSSHDSARRRHHRLRHDLRHLHAEHGPLSRAAGSSPAPTFARMRRAPQAAKYGVEARSIDALLASARHRHRRQPDGARSRISPSAMRRSPPASTCSAKSRSAPRASTGARWSRRRAGAGCRLGCAPDTFLGAGGRLAREIIDSGQDRHGALRHRAS